MIDSVTTVADIQAVLRRILFRIEAIEYEVATNASGAEQQVAAIRVDVRTFQLAPPPATQSKRIDLIGEEQGDGDDATNYHQIM